MGSARLEGETGGPVLGAGITARHVHAAHGDAVSSSASSKGTVVPLSRRPTLLPCLLNMLSCAYRGDMKRARRHALKWPCVSG